MAFCAEQETGAARVTFPKAVREQVWIHTCGPSFAHQCPVRWCTNQMSVFDFHVGHRVSLAAGGSNALDNLIPLCARCNLGMGRLSLEEWSDKLEPQNRFWPFRAINTLARRVALALSPGSV